MPNVWFSDVDGSAPKSYPWQPVLMEPDGMVLASLEIWFTTEAECDDWIKRNLLHTIHDGSSQALADSRTT